MFGNAVKQYLECLIDLQPSMETRTKGPGKRGHIVADTNVSPFARARNICCGHKFCVRDTKNVSDFVQKHFVSATNVSQFAQHKKHHEQQCVRNNVSSFASTLGRERGNIIIKIYFGTSCFVLEIPLCNL